MSIFANQCSISITPNLNHLKKKLPCQVKLGETDF